MKQTFEFEWNEEDLGRGWFNIYNLEVLLYSDASTRKGLLKVREVGFGTSEAVDIDETQEPM